jgi:hypothetical protein
MYTSDGHPSEVCAPLYRPTPRSPPPFSPARPPTASRTVTSTHPEQSNKACPETSSQRLAHKQRKMPDVGFIYKELSGRWGKTLSLQTRSCSDSCTIDTLHSAARARTLSGLKTSSYTAFLYARKIIFREEVPRARKRNNAGTAADAPGRETTEPEVDEDDSGTEGDTESDAEEGLLLLKHWLKQTEVNSWEKWGYEDPEVLPQAGVGGATTRSDQDIPEGVDSDAEAALNSSSGLSDLSD